MELENSRGWLVCVLGFRWCVPVCVFHSGVGVFVSGLVFVGFAFCVVWVLVGLGCCVWLSG